SSPGALDGLVIQTYPGTNSVPANDIGKSLAQAYTNVTHSDYYAFPSNTYTAVEVYAQAVGKAGTTNSDSVISALEKINYQGPTGQVTFDANHNWIFPGFWYVQIQNNTRVVILPQQFANGHFIPSS
ncbi:MAG: ABC transporter substrate-binding protein, partial [Nitrososphaerales archaeon]